MLSHLSNECEFVSLTEKRDRLPWPTVLPFLGIEYVEQLQERGIEETHFVILYFH